MDREIAANHSRNAPGFANVNVEETTRGKPIVRANREDLLNDHYIFKRCFHLSPLGIDDVPNIA